MPTEAMIAASVMKTRNVPDSADSSDVRSVTCSHSTASDGEPSASRSARSAAADSAVSIVSMAIEPSRSMCRVSRSATMTLASSLATSHRTRSPSGLRAASRRSTTLMTVGQPSSTSSTGSVRSAGTTIRRWTMGGLYGVQGALQDPASVRRQP
jgi:hypothetical protein